MHCGRKNDSGIRRHSGSEKPESLSFLHGRFHTGRTGVHSSSQGHLSGTSVSLNPETVRKQRASGFSPQSRLRGPAAFRQNIHMPAPGFHACTGQIHVTDSEKISVWKRMIRKFRPAFSRPDAADTDSVLPVSVV